MLPAIKNRSDHRRIASVIGAILVAGIPPTSFEFWITSSDNLIGSGQHTRRNRQSDLVCALRLMMNSNFVACSTGRSAGFNPSECCRRRLPLAMLSSDHLIRAIQHYRRDRNAESVRRLEIDQELKFLRLLHRKIRSEEHTSELQSPYVIS